MATMILAVALRVVLKITRMSDIASRSDAVRDAAETGIPRALADLGDLVRIPSIAWPSMDQQQLVRSAEAVAALVEGTRVFDAVTIKRAAIPGTEEFGQPAVLAARPRRSRRASRTGVLLARRHG